MQNEVRAILLCAGRGSRMNDDSTHKVCFSAGGVPVIRRLIGDLRTAGVTRFTVVIGHRADDVKACLADEKGISFALQKEQNGTADAVRCGLEALVADGYRGGVLVSMGDKLVSPVVVRSLLCEHRAADADASVLIQEKANNPSGGRVILRDGHFFAFLEQMDEARLRLMQLAVRDDDTLAKAISSFGLSEKKAQLLLAVAKRDAAEGKKSLPSPCHEITAEDADAVTHVNAAVYLWKNATFALECLSKTRPDNAQNELYFTDALTIAAAEGAKVHTLVATQSESVLSYSTKEELAALDMTVRKHESASLLRLASERIREIESGEMDKKLLEIYGPNSDPVLRRGPYLDALRAFIREYGDREVLISRAPGRVNLMGRHIEHRGGSTNILAIDREVVAIAAPRSDAIIHLANIDPEFSKTCFSVSQTMAAYDTADWVEFIESEKILEIVSSTRGDWSNYIKAGILRLQLNDRQKPLSGMDMLFSGNIPMAAGLSSSSALVVATMEAVIALNDLALEVEEFVALSGEGEWFVGSRGGAGDHAAMKCGKRGEITHMNFFPFSVGESVEWPSEYDVVVANSGIKAKKSDGARDKFNAMVTSYELAYLWILKEFPEHAERIHCLRDINAENLGITEADIYRMLLRVPLSLKTSELFELYPETWHNRIQRTLSTHHTFPEYRLRGVLLYGLSECARAEHCIDLLKEGDYERLGELMCLSHNGDRIWQNGAPHQGREDDDYLLELIAAQESGDKALLEASSLYNQPGVYACSTREIDMLIDYIISRDGVLGAQLSGAGLGGCVIALVKHESTQKLINSLNQIYYKVRGLEPSANIFTPVAGSLVF